MEFVTEELIMSRLGVRAQISSFLSIRKLRNSTREGACDEFDEFVSLAVEVRLSERLFHLENPNKSSP